MGALLSALGLPRSILPCWAVPPQGGQQAMQVDLAIDLGKVEGHGGDGACKQLCLVTIIRIYPSNPTEHVQSGASWVFGSVHCSDTSIADPSEPRQLKTKIDIRMHIDLSWTEMKGRNLDLKHLVIFDFGQSFSICCISNKIRANISKC
jgi:hypothetical protein